METAENFLKERYITMSHGAGTNKTDALIKNLFFKHWGNPALTKSDDAAELDLCCSRLAFSTDSYVVSPLFFKGADIGRLAVCGTVNDLAMQGAVPKYLSAAAVLEEGFELEKLERIVISMAKACEEAGVHIVTGDTKVVEKGKCDGIYINTSGIGLIAGAVNTASANAKEGDAVIVSGYLGEHGLAVLNQRHALGIEADISSDAAPLNHITKKLLDVLGRDVHVLRDLTRGGLGAALNDIAKASGAGIELYEKEIPVSGAVKSASAILGLNVLNIANEGKFVCVVKASRAEEALGIIKEFEYGKNAKICGAVIKGEGAVQVKNALGAVSFLRNSDGQELPRIC